MKTYEQERDEAAELHEQVEYKGNTDLDYYGVSDSFKSGYDACNARSEKVIADLKIVIDEKHLGPPYMRQKYEIRRLEGRILDLHANLASRDAMIEKLEETLKGACCCYATNERCYTCDALAELEEWKKTKCT